MNRTLGCVTAASLLLGCYASHQLAAEGRDGGGTTEAGPEMRDAGRPDGGDPSETPGTCREGCGAPSDCGGGSLRTCIDGACYFVGCDSDADCPPAAGCALERRQCRQRCAATSDCVELGSDGGEVACRDGLCRLIGCPSDAWCDDYAARWELEGHFRCVSRAAGAIPRCWRVCDVEADCAASDGEHPRTCADGLCRLIDCTASDQCRSWYEEDWLCVPR